MICPTRKFKDVNWRSSFWMQQLPRKILLNTGVFQIRDAKGKTSDIPIKCEIIVTTTNWQSVYKVFFTNTTEKMGDITHDSQQ